MTRFENAVLESKPSLALKIKLQEKRETKTEIKIIFLCAVTMGTLSNFCTWFPLISNKHFVNIADIIIAILILAVTFVFRHMYYNKINQYNNLCQYINVMKQANSRKSFTGE